MWICCQIGAREHYAVPRALHKNGNLRWLFTELWVRPSNPLGMVKRQLRERYHADLADATVRSVNGSSLAFEMLVRVKKLRGWPRILARNEWFQRRALRRLASADPHSSSTETPVLFAYSYAAQSLFRWAKSRGWRTVLGQIDAGPELGRITQRLEQRYPEYQSFTDAPPDTYWKNWREECSLADRIIVNSEWSRNALENEGIGDGKVKVVPLAYAAPADAAGFHRTYPAAFSAQRPMRILFLGKVSLGKGLVPLLEAADGLKGEAVEFQIVGPTPVAIAEKWRCHPQIRWFGSVPRGQAGSFYRQADVFLFPTFSDGFGLTQLEAQAWQLPVVASRFCGDVVKDRVNGVQLSEVNGASIVRTLRELLAAPEELSRMARASGVGPQFSLSGIAGALERALN